jgi:PadR family transcriptional regulator PadR
MKPKKDIQQGTLALMVLQTLDVVGPLQHGHSIARFFKVTARNLA